MRTALLLFVAFLSGALLMGLELVGSRVLAPHFGGSIFVWGSLIGVFLAALSLGYYIGGKVADRHPRAIVLAVFLFASGLFVLLIPKFGPGICDAIAAHHFGPRLDPLLACMILFFVPGVLMGATSPFVIRLTAVTIERVGQTSGAVYALSTVGSIVGTLFTSFYLISVMYTSRTLYLFGLLLLATSLIAAVVPKPALDAAPAKKKLSKKAKKSPAKEAAVTLLVAFLLAGALAQPAQAKNRTLLECDSPYQRLFVVQTDSHLILQTSSVLHTRMLRSDPQGRGFPYTDYIDLALLINPDIKNVLIIGLGGGTIPKRLVRDYPDMIVDTVEIDPKVVEIAKQYFHVKEGPRLRIHESDGRMFLRRSKQKYDLIMMDAYYADAVPFFLTTREFFAIVREKLSPGGIFLNNVIGVVSGPKSKFFRSIYRTTSEVFNQIHVFKVPEPGAREINIEIFAVKSTRPTTIATMKARLQSEDNPVKDKVLATRLVQNYMTGDVKISDVPTLQDDYAPVDALIHLW